MSLFEIVALILLVLLVVAMIGLFAMFGELASRVEQPSGDGYDEANDSLTPSDHAAGQRVDNWPSTLDEIGAADDVLLILLSPSCGSCNRIAPHIARHPAIVQTEVPVALLIPCFTEAAGESFIADTGLPTTIRTALDVEGEWARAQLGIDYSPAVVHLQEGKIRGAWIFGSMAAIEKLVIQVTGERSASCNVASISPSPTAFGLEDVDSSRRSGLRG